MQKTKALVKIYTYFHAIDERMHLNRNKIFIKIYLLQNKYKHTSLSINQNNCDYETKKQHTGQHKLYNHNS